MAKKSKKKGQVGPPETLAPKLFDFVIEYADKLADGDISPNDDVDGDNELILFAESFMAQFSKGHMGTNIEGFNSRSREQLTLERKRLEARETGPEAQKLIFILEELCSLAPELTYGGSEHDWEQFHRETVPELLAQIRAWLEAEAQLGPEVEEAAETAEIQYLESLDHA